MKKDYQISLLAVLLLLISQSLLAQADFSSLIQQSDAVIEGEVIKQETFWGENDRYIYTKNTLKIYKIFKGENLSSEIDLITLGGKLDGENHRWSHGFVVSLTEKGVFFLKESEGRNYNITHTHNGLISFKRYGQPTPKGYTPHHIFHNLEEDVYRPLYNITGKKEILNLNNYEKEILERSISLSSTDDCAEYKIKNLKITNVSPSNQLTTSSISFNLEFDIDIRSLQNAFDLSRTLLKMTYSTNILGTNLASSNNMVASLKSDFGSYELTLYDDAPDKVAVNIEKIQNSIAEEINNYHKGLYHAVIGIQNYDPTFSLSLTVDENLDVKTYKEINNVISEINCNIYDENVEVVLNELMAPVINSYNSTVTSGTKTLLSIYGNNFDDDYWSDSYVYFTNADVGNSSIDWIRPLRNDIIYWSNTLIQVYVPSYGLDAETGIGTGHEYAGTGKFKVITYQGESQEKDITVTYACQNETYVDQKTQPLFLTQGVLSDGYVIAYSETFKTLQDSNDKYFKDAFERALATWCNTTNLNYIIDEDATEYDLLVSYAPLGTELGNTLITDVYDENCDVEINNGSVNHPVIYPADFVDNITLVFNSLITDWDADNLITFDKSVEAVALHELGHAHGILHTNHDNELMYWCCGSVGAITSEASSASNYIQDHSLDHNCSSGNYSKNTNCTTGVLEISQGINLFSHYANNKIYISSDFLTEIDLIKVYSIDGKLINSLKNINSYELEIPFNQAQGIYIISYQYGNEIYSDKIVIAKK
jgi:hypothetical protein